MFTDLLKSLNVDSKAQKEELDDARLKDIMDELFKKSDESDEAEELEKASKDEAEESEELEKASEDEAEESEELEKASKTKRRKLMDQVYSLVDNLSEEELKSIVESKAMRKALAVELFDRLETEDLEVLVSDIVANGAEIGQLESLKMEKGSYETSDDDNFEKANTQEEEPTESEADEA